MKPSDIIEIDTSGGYDAWAAGYDAQDNPMIAAVERHLDTHRLPVAGARVLDIGCGTGRTIARTLTEGAAFVLGIDASPKMLARAAERLAVPIAAGRTALMQIDIARPWSGVPADFDLAVITLVLEHSATVSPILDHVARHLAPGALLFIAEIHPDMLRTDLGGHFERDGVTYSLPSYVHDREEFGSALAAAGCDAPMFDEVRADAATIAAIPKFAKRQGDGVLLTLRARRRA